MKGTAYTRLIYTAFLGLLLLVYFFLTRQVTPKFDWTTAIDNLIPFSAPFSVMYSSYLLLLWYGMIYAYLYFDLHRFKQFILGMVVIQLTAYVLYVLVPGKIIRPTVATAGIFFDLVRVIYAIDMPSGLTPSLHVANSWFIALALWNDRYLRPTMIVWALFIIASTLLIKQHFVVDVVSGIALSSAVYVVLDRYYKVKEKSDARSP